MFSQIAFSSLSHLCEVLMSDSSFLCSSVINNKYRSCKFKCPEGQTHLVKVWNIWLEIKGVYRVQGGAVLNQRTYSLWRGIQIHLIKKKKKKEKYQEREIGCTFSTNSAHQSCVFMLHKQGAFSWTWTLVRNVERSVWGRYLGHLLFWNISITPPKPVCPLQGWSSLFVTTSDTPGSLSSNHSC